eukprot:scaffold1966_cov118-Isochrysis_galbana.AAC.9
MSNRHPVPRTRRASARSSQLLPALVAPAHNGKRTVVVAAPITARAATRCGGGAATRLCRYRWAQART